MRYKEALSKLRSTFDEVLKKQPEVFTIKTIGYMLWTMEDEPKEMDALREQMIKLLRKYIHSSNITPNAIETIHEQISEEVWDDPDLHPSIMSAEEKKQKLSKKTMNFLDLYLQVKEKING